LKIKIYCRKAIPLLINVLKGEMSLIGPRPLLPEYLELYNDFQRRRNEVKPGITGWAQVNGRNSISWTQKFALDIEYVNKISCGLDIKILLLTIKKVLVREGVNQSNERPMQPFNGSN
jgi:lipopolysaccharide/colanic/teichoic acid biosynthesis glycosyltransferase